MCSRLFRITEDEWTKSAQAANYQAGRLAKLCGVSVRTLERHFKEQRAQSPQTWLNSLRMTKAQALILKGNSVKEAAGMLAFKDASQFSKDFKAYHGILPSVLAKGTTVASIAILEGRITVKASHES